MIISKDAERAPNKIQRSFMIKKKKKKKAQHIRKRNFLNTIKAIFGKSITNIIFNREILNAFLSMIRQSKEVHSHHFYSTFY